MKSIPLRIRDIGNFYAGMEAKEEVYARAGEIRAAAVTVRLVSRQKS